MKPGSSGLPLKEQYEAAVGEIATHRGALPSGSFEIPRDATPSACIAYTLFHVCGRRSDGTKTKSHYRYSRYWHALNDSLVSMKAPLRGPHGLRIAIDDMLPGEPVPPENPEAVDAAATSTCLVVADIGCGPGIFSWVVHDYFLSSANVDVKLFAVDRCPNMVHLAGALWERMDTRCDLRMHSDWCGIRGDFSNTLRSTGREFTVIVTLGHLLVQIVDDSVSIKDVAQTLADCVSLATASVPCGRCLVIAADAFSGTRRERFECAWERLQVTLADKHGVSLSKNPLPKYSQMCGEAMFDPRADRQGAQ